LDNEFAEANMLTGVCEATGIPFELEALRGWNTPSYDRIDSSLGYTKQNTRLVLFALNAACGTWGEQKVVQIYSAILKKRTEKSNALSLRLAERLQKKTEALGSSLYVQTWKERVTPAGRSLPQLVVSVPRTKGNGSTGAELEKWPTPNARDYKGESGAGRQERKDNPADTLSNASALASWYTPQVKDYRSGMEERVSEKIHGMSINDQVQLASWPTPNTMDNLSPRDPATFDEWNNNRGGTDNRKARTTCSNLRQQAVMNHYGQDTPIRLTASGQILTGSSAGMESGGQLSPHLSRWLMGLPPSWCVAAIRAHNVLQQRKRRK
jgi:hypothetical protein